MRKNRLRSYFENRDNQQAPQEVCAWEGCDAVGEFPAPKDRDDLRLYQWFCLEHIRAFNKSWNYFDGMSPAAVQGYMRGVEHGHRPTRPMNQHVYTYYSQIDDELRDLLGDVDEPLPFATASLPEDIKEAYDVMGLTYPVTVLEVKERYKVLVKRYHPDVNQGCEESEEEFKRILEAYQVLLESEFVR